MTKNQILKKLIAIAKTGSGRSPFLCADLVDQEDLYDIQEKLSTLMADLANDVGTDILSTEFPWAFQTEKVGS